MVNKTDEKDMEWVTVPDKTGFWDPINIGDKLVGVYKKKEKTSFMGRPNCLYSFETEHPNSVEGIIKVYGTTGLNNMLIDKLVLKLEKGSKG